MREMKDSGVEWLGEVPAEWDVSAIKYECSIVLGATPDSSNSFFWADSEEGVAWITPADFANGDTIGHGKRDITELGYKSCRTTLVPKGSIVVSTRAPIGKVAYVASPLCTNQGCKTLVLKFGGSYPRYIFYVMQAANEELFQQGRGTTFTELASNSLAAMRIPIPPLDEQHRIADYLDEKCAEIDRAVSAAERSIEKYKLLLSAVIDERFSRYGGRVKLSRISSLITDGDHQAPPRSDTGIPFLVISNISKGKIDFSNTDYVSEKYYESLPISRRAQKGDVLVSVTGSYGIPVVVDVERPFCFQRHIALVRPSVDSDYIRFAMKTSEFSQYCDGVVTGAAQKTLTLGCLRSAPIIDVPSAEVDVLVRDLLAKEAGIDAAIAAKRAIIADLKAYKRSLIYETVTGKREV